MKKRAVKNINIIVVAIIIVVIPLAFSPFLISEKENELLHDILSRISMSFAFPVLAGIVIIYATRIKKDFSDFQDSLNYNTGATFYDKEEYYDAFLIWEALAKKGYAKAEWVLGSMYYEGKGIMQNYDKALEWLSKAAEQGHVDAQNNLGTMYLFGEGVVQNDDKAFTLFSKAANQGQRNAQTSLGFMYQEGKGVTKDTKEAIKWYSRAAKQGYPIAQFNLGAVYNEGVGVRMNQKKAFMWMSIAVANDYYQASKALPIIESQMDISDIEEAKEMTNRCQISRYKDCFWEE